ncbi:hypothetical protein [Tuberibacillus sp. Marseille-P3662]|uniref:hypothetical protein n=1 Tax=Tuberibacillus sp. Marseille-P3662 TaxID=1965358 RepID=UPI000A1CBA1C|nr:hypothetical protein [Tuberibacillus sp. Marseille-P3662]
MRKNQASVKKTLKIVWGIAGGAFALLILVSVIVSIGKPLTEPDNKIEAIVNDEIGKKAEDEKPTYRKHEKQDGMTTIFLNGEYGWDDKGTRLGMIDDTKKLIPKIFDEIDNNKIKIVWYLLLQDQKGNESDNQVIRMMFTRKNSKSINWDNVLNEDIPKVADSYWEHPAMQK